MKKYISFLILFLMLLNVSYANELSNATKIRCDEYYNNGITLYKAKNYTSAISEFRKILRILPYDKTVRNALIASYLARAEVSANQENNYKKATYDIKSALFYLEYWENEQSSENTNLIQSAKENLKKLESKNLTEAERYKNAIAERQIGELATSGYDLNQIKGTYYKNALETLGDIYKSLNNEERAIDSYRKSIKLDNKNASACFKYALIMDNIGNRDAALEYYNLALQNGENNLQLLENLESLWNSRIIQEPNNAQNHINLGTVLQKKKDYIGAKAEYLKARTLDSSDMITLYNLASLYNEMDSSRDAIGVYNEILAKEPNNIKILNYRAQAQEDIKDIKGAISSYKTIIQINPNSENAQRAKAEIDRVVLKNYTGGELIDYLTVEANSNPNDFGAQYNLAYELHKQNKFNQAIIYYEKALKLKPDYENAYENLAQIYLNKNDTTNAKHIVDRGLNVLSNSKNLQELKNNITIQETGNLYEEGSKYWDKKEYKLALESYLKISNKTPEVTEAIACCYSELHDVENALKYYNQLLAKNPKDTNIINNIASVYYKNGNTQEAIKYYNEILTIEPNNTEIRDLISSITAYEENKILEDIIKFYENKDFYNAQLNLQKLLGKNPNNLYANYYRAVIFDEQNKLEEAIIYFKKTLKIDPNFALSYYSLGIIADKKERYKEAVGYYEKYLSIKSNENTKADDYTNFVKKRLGELKKYLASVNNNQ